MAAILLSGYFLVLGALALLGAHRLVLTWVALRAGARRPRLRDVGGSEAGAGERPPDPALPNLVVQLPIYNEVLVAERLLRACARLRYPAGRLEIQVLDDSTDETHAIVARVAHDLRSQGVRISVIHRDTRRGYKAGALAHGLAETDAELVAIFDADFVPVPDFLERVVPVLLAHPRCAMVQARWGHLNRDASMLTRAQAMFLDGHFGIEHTARAATGHFFNFNGTAGVWRRTAILDAGGWCDDTITEDLDLSYRAQLAGWGFGYVEDVIAPAELPESWAAFRAQQARWVRGSVQTAKKHLSHVLESSRLTPWVRLDAAVHLTNNFAYLFMALLALLLPLAVVLRSELGWRVPGGQSALTTLDISMLTAGTCAMVIFYAAAAVRLEGRLPLARIHELLFALCVGAGMSISNSREVLSGLFAKRSAFVRTPKRGDSPQDVALSVYRSSRAPLSVAVAEIVFAIYFLVAVIYALACSLFGAMPFLLLYLVGFCAVGGGSILESWKRRVRAREQMALEHQSI